MSEFDLRLIWSDVQEWVAKAPDSVWQADVKVGLLRLVLEIPTF